MGPFVPEVIKRRIYLLFASKPIGNEGDKRPLDDKAYENVNTNSKGEMDLNHVMTEEDFTAYYVVFNDLLDKEMSQVAFEMLKISPHHYCNQPPHLQSRIAPLQG